MSKTSTTFQTEVKHCWAYGKFAAELLEQVAKDFNLEFDTVWAKYFPDVTQTKALKNGRNFIKQCNPRKAIASARNDYQFYLTEQSEKIQKEGKSFDIAVHGKEIGTAWKALTDAQKKKYKDLAAKDKARHATELAEVEEKIRNGTLQESPFHRNTRKRTGNVSALNMYVSEMTHTLKESQPELGNTDRMKKIHDMWKNLDESEKANYQAKADEQNKSHATEGANTEAKKETTKPKASPKSTKTPAATTKKPAASKPKTTPAASGKKSSPKGKKN